MNRKDEIYQELKALNDELKDIRENCKHPTYTISTFSWRVGCFDNMRMCTECGDTLGEPSEKELDEFNQEITDKTPIVEEPIVEKQTDSKHTIGLDLVKIKPRPMGIGTKIYKNENI
jgi:hypothetical protein